jgi:hypothetical protein
MDFGLDVLVSGASIAGPAACRIAPGAGRGATHAIQNGR